MVYQLIFTSNQIFKQLLPVALTFFLGIEKFEKDVAKRTAIVMGVVETFSMKSPPS